MMHFNLIKQNYTLCKHKAWQSQYDDKNKAFFLTRLQILSFEIQVENKKIPAVLYSVVLCACLILNVRNSNHKLSLMSIKKIK